MASEAMDTERLSSIDEHGHKKVIIPAEVSGRLRRRRNWTQAVLIVVFLMLPWLRVAGQQAVWIDIAHREFTFFGLKLYAHDGPLLFLVLGTIAFGLFFVTNVWGRIWCGWACPQTVFIDAVFRRIEILVEGNYRERRLAREAPMNSRKLFRLVVKWSLFTAVSSLIAHSFIALFVGAQPLVTMMGTDPRENATYFILVTSITALILFDFGWFREQFCVIMCPYGRFQSLLMDSTSLAVVYDETRGEPRRGVTPAPGQKAGDCVSCRRCVEVCPTGIDIRRGVQMECISCSACVDACDEIMEKVKKPKGLIRYANLRGGSWVLRKPRAVFAGTLALVCVTSLAFAVANRPVVDVTVLRAKQSLFQDLGGTGSEHRFANQFHLHVRNQTNEAQEIRIDVDPADRGLSLVIPENPFHLRAGEDRQIPLFVQFPAGFLDQTGAATARLRIDTNPQPHQLWRSLHLVGPVAR